MARVFAPPEDVGDFEFDYSKYSFERHAAAEDAYTARLKEALPGYSKTPGDPLVGARISTPRGDGHAQYLVMSTRPLELVHLPVGDAWHADPVWLRGLRLADVRKMVAADAQIDAMFKRAAG